MSLGIGNSEKGIFLSNKRNTHLPFTFSTCLFYYARPDFRGLGKPIPPNFPAKVHKLRVGTEIFLQGRAVETEARNVKYSTDFLRPQARIYPLSLGRFLTRIPRIFMNKPLPFLSSHSSRNRFELHFTVDLHNNVRSSL